MTLEQELIEKIANIELAISRPREDVLAFKKLGLTIATDVVALVKEALPKLAKEAGYVKPAEDQGREFPDIVFFCPTCSEVVKNTMCKIVEPDKKGYAWRKVIL